MKATIEECFHIARGAVVTNFVDECNELHGKIHLIRSLYGDEGLSEEARKQINELSGRLTEIAKVEYLICYELDALRKNADELIKNHSY